MTYSKRWHPRTLLGTLLLGAMACSGPAQGPKERSGADPYRERAARGDDSELVAEWLLAELFAPGGSVKEAERARKRLDELGKHGLLSDLARGIDDELHGRLAHASDHYLNAARAARSTRSDDSQLLAHFAVRNAISLSSDTRQLWQRWQAWVQESIERPRHLGWRSRDELLQWWVQEAWSDAAEDVEAHAVEKLGCFEHVRLAGPFGMGVRADVLRSHEPERLQVWPQRFTADPHSGSTPRMVKTERTGCTVEVADATTQGVFYAEATFTVPRDVDAILVVKNALAVWVDGERVFDRDLREWGSWTKIGAGLRIPAGSHRVVARLMKPETSVRLLHPDGLPLQLTEHEGHSGLVGVRPARVTFEPSLLRGFVRSSGVRDPGSPWVRYAAADLAHADGEDEVASLLLEPLVRDVASATGPALSTAAAYVEGDPIFDAAKTQDMMRALHEQAIERDPNLWVSDLSVVGQLAKSQGIIEALPAFERLTERYDEVPPLLGALASVYAELGWTPEYSALVKRRAERFPDDTEGLYAAAQVLTDEGKRTEAEALYERIRELDPDSEVFVGLSLERKDYPTALTELERLKARRPQQKSLLRNIEDTKVQSGAPFDPLALLAARVEQSPLDPTRRLALADAKYAAGDRDALRNSIVDSIQAGADPEPTKEALDLVEGSTELEAYRLDGRQIIREYEAAGAHLPGTAARVLDYMAAWVRADGSARLLEHEILRLQSEEAIGRFAEHEVRADIVLQMRVIKKDGRVLEPERVAGKPTLTFPHLEVGDYIETEQIYAEAGTPGGSYYDGPHWFFREQGVAYARSEFVVIAPAHRQLDIASTGPVPAPTIEERGYFRVHRWRVDRTPPAPVEPMSVPIAEYLPSVRISWGLDLPRHLRLLTSQVVPTTPVDPRIVRIAQRIVEGVPAADELERAKRLYHWVLANVQEGEEDDGRRVITGKQGNPWRAFETLCRALRIDVAWALAKNRLAAPPRGPDEAARQYGTTVLKVGGAQPTWLTFDGKFVPFGYLPAAVRGMPAYLLEANGPVPLTLPSGGTHDGVSFEVNVKLAVDGSAELRVVQRYEGQYAASLRRAFDELPETRLHDVLEERLLASAFPGARLLEYELQQLEDSDAPLAIVMQAEMAHFARVEGNQLKFPPPYATRLSQLAALPVRQTALLIGAERHQTVDLTVELPPGARAEVPPARTVSFQDFRVTVADEQAGRTLRLRRSALIPATRIAPEDYLEFQRFTRDADNASTRDVSIGL